MVNGSLRDSYAEVNTSTAIAASVRQAHIISYKFISR